MNARIARKIANNWRRYPYSMRNAASRRLKLGFKFLRVKFMHEDFSFGMRIVVCGPSEIATV